MGCIAVNYLTHLSHTYFSSVMCLTVSSMSVDRVKHVPWRVVQVPMSNTCQTYMWLVPEHFCAIEVVNQKMITDDDSKLSILRNLNFVTRYSFNLKLSK
jgi:hypothetical protein